MLWRVDFYDASIKLCAVGQNTPRGWNRAVSKKQVFSAIHFVQTFKRTNVLIITYFSAMMDLNENHLGHLNLYHKNVISSYMKVLHFICKLVNLPINWYANCCKFYQSVCNFQRTFPNRILRANKLTNTPQTLHRQATTNTDRKHVARIIQQMWSKINFVATTTTAFWTVSSNSRFP